MSVETSHESIDVQCLNELAVVPQKIHDTDVGYDVTLTHLERVDDALYTYGTCIAVRPPNGYYLELVPRSSLCSLGFILACSVGVIDPSYRGEVRAKLFKFDRTKPDLRVPGRYLQLVLRKVYHDYRIQKVDTLDVTERGTCGFGSTGI